MSIMEFKVAKSTLVPFTVLREDDTADLERLPSISDEDLRALYRTMVLTRLFDERMVTVQRQGRISFYMPCLGEEASTVGSSYALRKEDWIFPCYREQGAYLWRGATLQEMAHQCFGNSMDYTKGRQMPVHYSFRHLNVVSVSSPLMTQVPQAVGTAWAMKLRRDPAVVLTYFGEGATSEGDFHVGMNFAGVYQTPTIFFLRNNGWAISTPCSVQSASENFAMKAAAYGFEGVQVDGTDILAVIAVTRKAAEKARNGGGPTLIEALTYRVGPHSTSDDPTGYRTEEDVKPWLSKDPVARFQRYLEKRGLWTPEWESEILELGKEEILRAVETAEATPAPKPETLFDDVFSEKPWFLREQEAELMDLLKQTSGTASEQSSR